MRSARTRACGSAAPNIIVAALIVVIGAAIAAGVKDIIDTADMPTGYGSSLYETFRPPRDAACVALARHAGALMLGKTVTTEFAFFRPGPTTNPHDATIQTYAPPPRTHLEAPDDPVRPPGP